MVGITTRSMRSVVAFRARTFIGSTKQQVETFGTEHAEHVIEIGEGDNPIITSVSGVATDGVYQYKRPNANWRRVTIR